MKEHFKLYDKNKRINSNVECGHKRDLKKNANITIEENKSKGI